MRSVSCGFNDDGVWSDMSRDTDRLADSDDQSHSSQRVSGPPDPFSSSSRCVRRRAADAGPDEWDSKVEDERGERGGTGATALPPTDNDSCKLLMAGVLR